MTLASFVASLLASVSAWTPTNASQFWATPEKTNVLTFQAQGDVQPDDAKYVVRTTDGDELRVGVAKLEGDRAVVEETFEQGFFEVEFPATNQSFGIASQPPFIPEDALLATDAATRTDLRERDPFFAIDAASTWLVRDDQAREDLIRNARRFGLATYRERVNWTRIEPTEGAFDYQGDMRAETVRQLAKKYDMPVLELFHNAPEWTGKVGAFPKDLIKTADAWGEIAERWSTYWNSIEAWNEPDISFSGYLPADQYVPVLKTVGQEFRRRGIETPIVGGIIAAFRDDYMDSLAENGGLDACDIFSFHTYCRAYDMEGVSLRYLKWLEKNGAEWKPTWLTECGRPWKKGTSRPNREADLASAIDIVQKGVVAKALGIDAYFPFVYVFYEENDNNFGMSDRNNAPLRSAAAYARSVYLLAGKECAGTWKLDAPSVERAYLFQDRQTREQIAVLYAREPDPDRTVLLPTRPTRVERATGEPLEPDADGRVDFSDGFLFVALPDDYKAPLAEPNAVDAARRLRNAARIKRGVDPRRVSTIVLRFDYDPETTTVGTTGYALKDPDATAYRGAISVYNFSDERQTFAVAGSVARETEDGEFETFDALSGLPEAIEVPGRGAAQIPFTFDATEVSPFFTPKLTFRVGDETLSFTLARSVSEAGYRRFVKENFAMNLSDGNPWRKNCSANGTIEFNEGLDRPDGLKGWGFDARFQPDGDRWAYPTKPLTFREGTNEVEVVDAQGEKSFRKLSDFRGVAFRVKGSSSNPESALRFFTYSDKGNYYYTSAPFAKADGVERFVAISFASLSAYGGTPDAFDPTKIHSISIGGNARGDELKVEVGEFYFFR